MFNSECGVKSGQSPVTDCQDCPSVWPFLPASASQLLFGQVIAQTVRLIGNLAGRGYSQIQ